jgi:hypothetical protein
VPIAVWKTLLLSARGVDLSSFYIWIHSGGPIDNGPLRGERARRSRGEGLFSSSQISECHPNPHAGSPLPQAGEGCPSTVSGP